MSVTSSPAIYPPTQKTTGFARGAPFLVKVTVKAEANERSQPRLRDWLDGAFSS